MMYLYDTRFLYNSVEYINTVININVNTVKLILISIFITI